jgi:hypothetical protein
MMLSTPTMADAFLSNPMLLGAPFFVAGSLKVIYDILLYRSFREFKEQEYKDALLGKD